jgi:hypothetical protein
MTAIRWMKGLCLACLVFLCLGVVAHAFSIRAFKSLKHVSQDPKPEHLAKDLVSDFDDFVEGVYCRLSNVLHVVFCYAMCCLAERFAIRKKLSPAELDYTDQPQSPGG